MRSPGSRLSRWSRLKAEARGTRRGMAFTVPGDEEVSDPVEAPTDAEPVVDETAARGNEVAAPDASHDAAVAEAAEAEEADLPDVETLDAESDYTPFMSDKVSDAVRNVALRKLWRSDAVFANLDGLIDYGEDFSDAATVVAGMQTTYKVGRGMVYETEEGEAEAEGEELASETDGAVGEVPRDEGMEEHALQEPDTESTAADGTPSGGAEPDDPVLQPIEEELADAAPLSGQVVERPEQV